MILFYSEHRNQDIFSKITVPYTVTNDLEEYKQNPTPTKIAITTNRFNFSLDENNYTDYVNLVNSIADISRYVFLIDSELHFDNSKVARLINKNVYYSLPGIVDGCDNQIFNGSFFIQVRDAYNHLPAKIAELNPYDVKPKYFDALLGVPKLHRDFIFDAVSDNNLSDKIVLSYNKKDHWNPDRFIFEDHYIWEPGTNVNGKLIDGTTQVEYYGVRTSLSLIIPIQIYNQTAYSIVAETNTDNTFSFFTEKTVKPILAKRLFVVFSGYKFLHNLRQLGFKTFDGIIDESYDLIQNSIERYTKAFEQIKILCSMPQQEVLDLIKPIVEYNYNFLLEQNFRENARQKIADIINQ
jgi:hypothetical protein